jgi:hypothetical protein
VSAVEQEGEGDEGGVDLVLGEGPLGDAAEAVGGEVGRTVVGDGAKLGGLEAGGGVVVEDGGEEAAEGGGADAGLGTTGVVARGGVLGGRNGDAVVERALGPLRRAAGAGGRLVGPVTAGQVAAGPRGGRALALAVGAWQRRGGEDAVVADGVGQLGGFGLGLRAELGAQEAGAGIELLQGSAAAAAPSVDHHELAVGVLEERIEGQPALGGSEGGVEVVLGTVEADEAVQSAAEEVAEPFSVEDVPVVEVRAAGHGEAGEEVAAVERDSG